MRSSFAKTPLRLMAWLVAAMLQGLIPGMSLPTHADVPGPYQLDPTCYTPAPARGALPPGKRSPGTLRMAERLAQIHRDRIPGATLFFNDKAAASIAAALPAAANPMDKVRSRFELARESMRAGRPDHALNLHLEMERILATNNLPLPKNALVQMQTERAIAFLRMGEQENCIGQPSAESCLFPLSDAARHRLPRGSRGAIEILQGILRDDPNDSRALWLLNIAYMTLGEYPGKVPPDWLITPDTFASEQPMPRFPNVAAHAGLDLLDLAGGVICDDFDNDGFLDVMASSWGLDGQLRFYRNNGDGSFTECAADCGLAIKLFVKGVTCADYDNDGDTDLYLSVRAGPNVLMRNDGPEPSSAAGNRNARWRFTDVSIPARVTQPSFSFAT